MADPGAGVVLTAGGAAFIASGGRTIFGRRLYAIGGDREAAHLAGLPVTGLRLSASSSPWG